MTDMIREELPAAIVNYVQSQQIIKRVGRVGDIVDTMIYLTSAQLSFRIGETLKVGGGFTLGL